MLWLGPKYTTKTFVLRAEFLIYILRGGGDLRVGVESQVFWLLGDSEVHISLLFGLLTKPDLLRFLANAGYSQLE